MEAPKILSVSQINYGIKNSLEGQFSLVWLRGEISNFKPHSSGHFYFSLKDAKSQISAVMFRGYNLQLKFKPKDGVEVIVRGRISVYEPRGNYQMFCETMEPVGAGALQRAFEELKLKLKNEGLFESDRKKQIPTLPKHVALVTSPTGAAVKDMLNVIKRRHKGLKISIVPCRVQGKEAPGEIIAALKLIEEYNLSCRDDVRDDNNRNDVGDNGGSEEKAARQKKIDVVICGRGGGSIEDLWAFNKENLARAIAEFPLPIISAVGHEIDFTIADFVADLRAPTPSAAAELVVQNTKDLDGQVLNLEKRILGSLQNQIRFFKQNIFNLEKRLVDPKRYLEDLSLRCDDLMVRLETGMYRYIGDCRVRVNFARQKMVRPDQRLQTERKRLEVVKNSLVQLIKQNLSIKKQQINSQQQLLDSFSPLKVVDRGYAIVAGTDKKKLVIKSVKDIKVGSRISIRFANGEALAKIEEVKTVSNK